jgi:CHAD domain-containing protein
VLWCLRHGSAQLQFKELDQSLKSLGGRLGKIREVDVAVRDAKQFGLSRSGFTGRKKSAQKKLRKWINREERSEL